jgi:hypothetical protein
MFYIHSDPSGCVVLSFVFFVRSERLGGHTCWCVDQLEIQSVDFNTYIEVYFPLICNQLE